MLVKKAQCDAAMPCSHETCREAYRRLHPEAVNLSEVGGGAVWGIYATSLLVKLQGTSFDRGDSDIAQQSRICRHCLDRKGSLLFFRFRKAL